MIISLTNATKCYHVYVYYNWPKCRILCPLFFLFLFFNWSSFEYVLLVFTAVIRDTCNFFNALPNTYIFYACWKISFLYSNKLILQFKTHLLFKFEYARWRWRTHKFSKSYFINHTSLLILNMIASGRREG